MTAAGAPRRRDAADPGTVDLFVYGTLTHPPMLEALVGRALSGEDATLGGYERLTLRMADLPPVPAIRPRPDASVPGQVVDGLDGEALRVLGAFELGHAGLYLRREVVVRTGAVRRRAVQAYVAGPASRPHLAEPWDREAFLERYGRLYLEQIIPGFLAGLAGRQSAY